MKHDCTITAVRSNTKSGCMKTTNKIFGLGREAKEFHSDIVCYSKERTIQNKNRNETQTEQQKPHQINKTKRATRARKFHSVHFQRMVMSLVCEVCDGYGNNDHRFFSICFVSIRLYVCACFDFYFIFTVNIFHFGSFV